VGSGSSELRALAERVEALERDLAVTRSMAFAFAESLSEVERVVKDLTGGLGEPGGKEAESAAVEAGRAALAEAAAIAESAGLQPLRDATQERRPRARARVKGGA